MRVLWIFFSFFKTFLQKGDFDNVFLFKKKSGRFFFMKILLIYSSFFLILNFLFSHAKKWGSGPKLLKGLKTSKTNFRGWNYLIYILARHSTLLNCWKHTSLTHTTSKITYAHLQRFFKSQNLQSIFCIGRTNCFTWLVPTIFSDNWKWHNWYIKEIVLY